MIKKNKVCLCFTRPKDTYVGGVCSMINSYISNKELFADNGYDVSLFDYHCKKRFKNSKVNNIFYSFCQRKRLIEYIRRECCEILNIHTSREFLFIKDVLLGKAIKKRFGTKTVLNIHVGDASTVFNRIPAFLQKKLINDCNKYFDKVVFLTDKIRRQFIERGLKEDKGTVLYNFYDFGFPCEELSQFGSNKDELELTFIGMINRDKGILELLKAVIDVKERLNIKLNICGTVTDPSIEEQFNGLISQNPDIVKAHGYVDKQKKYDILSDSSVLILPSYHEGFPLVILEALVTGCAIIATPVGAIPEVLDEQNYMSIEPGSVDSITNAISYLYENRDKLKEMQRANYQKSKNYTLKEHVNNLTQIYDCIRN